MKIDPHIILERLKFYRDELNVKDLVTIGLFPSVQHVYNAQSKNQVPESFKDGTRRIYKKEAVYDYVKNLIEKPHDNLKELENLVLHNRNAYISQIDSLKREIAHEKQKILALTQQLGTAEYERSQISKKYEELKKDTSVQYLIEQNNKNVLKIKELEDQRKPWWKII